MDNDISKEYLTQQLLNKSNFLLNYIDEMSGPEESQQYAMAIDSLCSAYYNLSESEDEYRGY